MSRNFNGFRLPRIWANSILREIAPAFRGEIINVSGWDDRDKEDKHYRDYFSGACSYYISNYQGERGVDSAAAQTDFVVDLSVPLPREYTRRFDVVFNHTTLEHIFDVELAFSNLCAMSKDIVIIVVPFAQELHYTSSYGDYWRFTPMSIRSLFEKNQMTSVYEACGPVTNNSVYLVMVGSRNPDKWQNNLPDWSPITSVGKILSYTPQTLFQRFAYKLWLWSKR